MKQILRFNKIIKSIIIAGDLCILNALFITLYYVLDTDTQRIPLSDSLPQLLVLLNLVYLLCNYSKGVVTSPPHRTCRPYRNACRTQYILPCHGSIHQPYHVGAFRQLVHTLPSLYSIRHSLHCLYYTDSYSDISSRYTAAREATVVLLHLWATWFQYGRTLRRDDRRPTSGFKGSGYFAEHPSDNYPKECRYLGTPQEVIPYLKKSKAEHLYCGLTSSHSKDSAHHQLLRKQPDSFYSVPNVRNYLKRRMHLELIGNVPVLDIRQEPLAQPENRLAKRLFDIVFSPIVPMQQSFHHLIIMGLAIKITSPGPIFFKQKRSGKTREFWCYKFRSMRVNKDSDKVQATLKRPAQNPSGQFHAQNKHRRTAAVHQRSVRRHVRSRSRPHMLKHTEEYPLIDKYMVRHLVKPGITGWAQVTGFRGRDQGTLADGRTRGARHLVSGTLTFMLDLYIIYKTVKNAVKGEKEAY